MSEAIGGAVSQSGGKKRGGWLTFWLVLTIIANLGTAAVYFMYSNNPIMLAKYPNVPVSIFYIYAVGGLINVILAILLLKWKKWPFFAYCVIAVIVFILNYFVMGVGLITALFGMLVGPVILYLSMRSRWNLFT